MSQSLESALKQVDDLTVAKADLEKSAAELDIARKQLEEELLSTKTKLNDTLESNSKLLQRHKHDVEVMKSAYDKKRDELDSCEAKLVRWSCSALDFLLTRGSSAIRHSERLS